MIPALPDFPVVVDYARSLQVAGVFRGFERNTKGQQSVVIEQMNTPQFPVRYTIALDHIRGISPAPLVAVTPVPEKKRRSKGRRK